jgi:hypothetical protein
MRRVNLACDLLCDFIRRGGAIQGPVGVPRPAPPRYPSPPRVVDIRFDDVGTDHPKNGVAVKVNVPDRYTRLELDVLDAMDGCTRSVRFVRREPGRCHWCAGLGASPTGPKRVCPECAGARMLCDTCGGRGWIHLHPGSCTHCDGTGAALVECTVFLRLPGGIDRVRRARVPGWGDLSEDGVAGDLWVDLAPVSSNGRTMPWHFEHFGHNWPPPQGRLQDGWLAIGNSPLPDPEMRELGFWRDLETGEWVRPAPSDGGNGVIDQIRQRQFFVPQAGAG